VDACGAEVAPSAMASDEVVAMEKKTKKDASAA
jgi:hypothetical protein